MHICTQVGQSFRLDSMQTALACMPRCVYIGAGGMQEGGLRVPAGVPGVVLRNPSVLFRHPGPGRQLLPQRSCLPKRYMLPSGESCLCNLSHAESPPLLCVRSEPAPTFKSALQKLLKYGRFTKVSVPLPLFECSQQCSAQLWDVNKGV